MLSIEKECFLLEAVASTNFTCWEMSLNSNGAEHAPLSQGLCAVFFACDSTTPFPTPPPHLPAEQVLLSPRRLPDSSPSQVKVRGPYSVLVTLRTFPTQISPSQRW